MRNRPRLAIGTVVLLLATLGVVLAVPGGRRFVGGLVERENFFDGQPTRSWRHALREEIGRGDPSFRPVASALLHGGPEVVPVLIDLLQDDDPAVRAMAADLLPVHFQGTAGREVEKAIGPLIAALGDAEKTVRARAAQSLAGIGAPARNAVPQLAALLADPDPTVAFHAANALEEIGPDARSALPALFRACDDARPAVRGRARMAVQALDLEAAIRAGFPPLPAPPPPLKENPPRRR